MRQKYDFLYFLNPHRTLFNDYKNQKKIFSSTILLIELRDKFYFITGTTFFKKIEPK